VTTFTHPSEWAVLPKRWTLTNVRGEIKVAAIMPYPGPMEDRKCDDHKDWITTIDKRGTRINPRVERLRAICHTCPLEAACREWGIAHEDDLMFGGLTPAEREVIRTGRNQVIVEPSGADERGLDDEAHIQLKGKSRIGTNPFTQADAPASEQEWIEYAEG